MKKNKKNLKHILNLASNLDRDVYVSKIRAPGFGLFVSMIGLKYGYDTGSYLMGVSSLALAFGCVARGVYVVRRSFQTIFDDYQPTQNSIDRAEELLKPRISR